MSRKSKNRFCLPYYLLEIPYDHSSDSLFFLFILLDQIHMNDDALACNAFKFFLILSLCLVHLFLIYLFINIAAVFL